MTQPSHAIQPLSPRRLAVVTAGAAVVAAVIVVAVIMPAEFHKDPTGFGKLSGLGRLAGPKETIVAPAAGAAAGASRSYPTPFRSDTIDIPLASPDAGTGGEELEYKVKMKGGDSLIYSWTVDGDLAPEEFYSDFHGESPPAPDVKIAEYRQATGKSDNGVLITPWAGVHGWYLQNQSAKPVVVHLKLSGFYELVPPGEKGNEARIKVKPQT